MDILPFLYSIMCLILPHSTARPPPPALRPTHRCIQDASLIYVIVRRRALTPLIEDYPLLRGEINQIVTQKEGEHKGTRSVKRSRV